MPFSVYKHTNKKNGKIYIGITGQDVKRRWQNGSGYYGTYFYNAIKKYGWDGFAHEVLYTDLTKAEAERIEVSLIAEYQSNKREHGYNIADGGNVVFGNHERIGSKNHKSESVNVYDCNGNYITTYESQNIAAKELGINRKGITKNCIGGSSTYKGYIFTYANKSYVKKKKYPTGKHPNHHKTAVYLLDDDGNVIERYASLIEAAEKHHCRANGISKCCNGYLKTYQGRRWSSAV